MTQTSSRSRFDIRESGRSILTVLAIALAANVLFALAFVRPSRSEFARLENDSQPRMARASEREKDLAAREEHLAALRQAEEDLARLRSDVLATREKRMIEVQLELASLTRQFGIGLDRVQYEPPGFFEGIERFGMVVPLEGGYANLRRFLQAVEGSKRFLLIDRVALAQGADGGDLIQLNITLSTFFATPEALAAPAPRAPARRTAGRT